MIRSKLYLILFAVLLLFSNLIFASESLIIQGSSTVLPIVQKAAEVYMEKNPDVNISVREAVPVPELLHCWTMSLILPILPDSSRTKRYNLR